MTPANLKEKVMREYQEFTFGWLIFAMIIPIHLLLSYTYFTGLGNRPMGTTEFLIVTSVLVLTCLLFYGLTTRVTEDHIVVVFGVGLIRKKIKLSRIVSVETVTSPWYYGWGIRFIPNGILYNISGTEGVELKFSDTNRIVRIGSKDAGKLKQEILHRL